MRKIALSAVFALSFTLLSAQNPPTEQSAVDSIKVRHTIFDDMPSVKKGDRATVEIILSDAIRDSLASRMARSQGVQKIKGYRLRIFFSSEQNARSASAAAENLFHTICPEHATYRSYENPYFKVTVGNFRTKSEALQLKESISSTFPTSFIVHEEIVCDL